MSGSSLGFSGEDGSSLFLGEWVKSLVTSGTPLPSDDVSGASLRRTRKGKKTTSLQSPTVDFVSNLLWKLDDCIILLEI